MWNWEHNWWAALGIYANQTSPVIVKSSRTLVWSSKVEAGQWMLAAAGRMMEATDYLHAKLHQYTSLLDDTVSTVQYSTVQYSTVQYTSLLDDTVSTGLIIYCNHRFNCTNKSFQNDIKKDPQEIICFCVTLNIIITRCTSLFDIALHFCNILPTNFCKQSFAK